MVIDFYTHYVPQRYADALAHQTSGVHADAGRIADLSELFPGLLNMALRIEHMDRHQCEMQVLTPLPLPVEQFLSAAKPDQITSLVQLANDSLAEDVAKHSDRFVGIALLSFREVGAAVEEFSRAVLQLGMKGAMLFTNVEGRPLDSPDLFPIYQKAVELDVPLWIHPVSWNYYPWMREYLLWQIFGWPFDTTLAMARVVYSGMFEKFSGLQFITHHSGGVMPYLSDRIADTYEQTEEFRTLYAKKDGVETSVGSITRHPLDSFRRFYADVALSGSLPALRCSYAFFGANQLVFGTDYPFGPEKGERFLRSNLRAVRALQIGSEERERILSVNAKVLLHLT